MSIRTKLVIVPKMANKQMNATQFLTVSFSLLSVWLKLSAKTIKKGRLLAMAR